MSTSSTEKSDTVSTGTRGTDSRAVSDEAVPAALREETYIVIAAYNESSVLGDVVDEIRPTYPNVIVVDDGSEDDTYEHARRHARFVLRHLINRGQGAALQTGIEFALCRGAQYIVTFDADGQHQPQDVIAMLEPIARGECDITLGSRFLGEAVDLPLLKRIVLRGGVLFTRIVNGVKLTDAHNGLRAFSRRAAEQIRIRADRMAHASEIIDLVKATGLRFQEVPVRIRYTAYSLAKGQGPGAALRIALQYFLGRIMK